MIPPNTGVAGFCVSRNTSVSLKDAYADPRFFSDVDAKTGLRTDSILCVPIAARDRVYGCIELVNAIEGSPAGGFRNEAMIEVGALAAALGRRLADAR
jgi:hypothetical protein